MPKVEQFQDNHITTKARVTLLQEVGRDHGVTVLDLGKLDLGEKANPRVVEKVQISGFGSSEPFWMEVGRRTRKMYENRSEK